MLYHLISDKKTYPWLVTVLCMLIVTCSNGLINSGITVYDESLLKEFGWTISQLKVRDSISFLAGSLFVVVAGWLVDRYGFKPFLLLGMAFLAVGYAAYGQIQSLTHIYMLHVLFAMVIGFAGNMAAIVTAASWVTEKRGLAIGMTIAGTSFGGMVIPPLANWLNHNFGWRKAMSLEAFVPIVMFLLIYFFIQNKTKTNQNAGNTLEQTGMSYAQALRTPSFYWVALAGALTYYAILSLFSHLFLYMRSFSFSPKDASLGISTLAMAGLTGKLVFGYLSDRINPFILIRALMVLMLLGLIGISQAPPQYIWLFLVVTGFGWGGLHTLYNFILLTLFGLKEAGKINGMVSLAEAIGGGVGISLTGYLHDFAGGYGTAFGVVVALMVVATAAIFLLKRPDNT